MNLPPAGRLRHAAIYCIGAGASLFFICTVVNIAGIEVVALYLRTSYRFYPFILLGFPAATGLLCLILAIRFAFETFRGGDGRPHMVMQTTAALMLLACVAASGFFFRQQLRRHADAPSAPERFHARIGPIAQFGPFSGRHTDASSSMVVWYFDPVRNNAPSELEYGADAYAAPLTRLREAAGGDGRRHEFHLTGLLSGTRYRYRTPAGSGVWRTFSTAQGTDAALRFLCLADTGNTLSGTGTRSYYSDVTRAAAGWYRATGAVPSFMVHGGDMVRTGTDLDGWRTAFTSNELAGSLPLVAAPGNHDFLEDGGANFCYFFGSPDYYSIDYGNCRIILLHPYDGPGRTLDGPVISTGAEQYRWVKHELARPRTGKWLIVVIHNPILSTGDYGVNELLAEQYLSLFKKQRVDLVISGHDHNFDAFLTDRTGPRGGTLYLVAGTGGSHLDAGIMDRPERRWLDWKHDRTSIHGLYQNDYYTKNFHLYGELSWGFTDVELRGDTMTVTYRRWLSFPRFLDITGQYRKAWEMVPLDDEIIPRSGMTGVERAWSTQKKSGG